MSDFSREIRKRIIHCFMDYIIISALANDGGWFSGYDIIKYVYSQFRYLPSSGTVYSTLYAMERAGLVYGVQNGRRRIYHLTPKALSVIKEREEASDVAQKLVARVFSARNVCVSQSP